MTNSMIPYSFTPGTKAKAQEVNANFNALADKIDKNDSTALHYNTSATISGNMTFTKPIVSTANGIVTTGNIVTKLANKESTDVIMCLKSGTTDRIGSLKILNDLYDAGNQIALLVGNDTDKGETTSGINISCKDGQYTATCPTYTANYADSSSKIVTTAFLTNRWTTSKATTSSSASKARPAVIIQNYVSGTNWYRVWSDGWIEQGGRAYVYFSASSANEGENVTTISFLKAFTNTNYMPVFTVERYSSEVVSYTDDSTVLIQAVTNNNMRVFCYDGGNNWYHTYIRWQACGY